MKELEEIRKHLQKEAVFADASRIISFDQSTVCPEEAVEEKNEIIATLEQQAFLMRRDEAFLRNVRRAYEKRETLDEWDRAMVEQLHRNDLMEQNLSTDRAYEYALIEKKAFVDWTQAKEASDFSLFRESLEKVIGINRERSALRVVAPEENWIKCTYDRLIDRYERGMNVETIDPCFAECAERLSNLLSRIRSSKKKIRTDFLSRVVPEEQQRRVTEYLMTLQGFDPKRGTYSTSEHAYTERLSPHDIRITTHIYPDSFLSNVYTVLHETGHALFDQRQPEKNNAYFLYDGKTFGMHESVSRFYENLVGRSEPFLSAIYPKLKELMPEALSDVSAKELYEAANLVQPSLIRTEADEVTYAFHIIIRYELEKAIFEEGLAVEQLPAAWNDLYEKYLGIRPGNDKEGVLQDVHWTSDFGYFPAYLLGNFYNAMYVSRMKQEIDYEGALAAGDLTAVNDWMAKNVFEKADRLSPSEWLLALTGRTVTADDFMTYLEEKYGALYQL
ncbi:MAG: carboxypeptidase M32 [Lachnospiraceae bacterium]|nr:carboxypeptidase M32 [Lachnospiraceae bacterium]